MFLTLNTFSIVGGIQRIGKVTGMALYELSLSDGSELSIYSMCDKNNYEQPYFPNSIFKGFSGRKVWFVINAVKKGMAVDTVLLSHVNLSIAGYFIKLLSPKTKLILFAHGREVWVPFKGWKKKLIAKFDRILPVSEYTKEVMKKLHRLPEAKLRVINNCLDPFLPIPETSEKDKSLMNRYGLVQNDIILMTVTRMSINDRNKGYDKVFLALRDLKAGYPNLKYLVVGKYDKLEKQAIDTRLKELGIEALIKFTGFIPEEQLAKYFNLADIYIMPSKKEGFGIVFIEAMYYGKPVIAGNVDGSVDALFNGKLGLLVNPESLDEIINAIIKVLNNKTLYLPDKKLLLTNFGYDNYKKRLSCGLNFNKNNL